MGEGGQERHCPRIQNPVGLYPKALWHPPIVYSLVLGGWVGRLESERPSSSASGPLSPGNSFRGHLGPKEGSGFWLQEILSSLLPPQGEYQYLRDCWALEADLQLTPALTSCCHLSGTPALDSGGSKGFPGLGWVQIYTTALPRSAPQLLLSDPPSPWGRILASGGL